jgi:hypothetical protein
MKKSIASYLFCLSVLSSTIATAQGSFVARNNKPEAASQASAVEVLSTNTTSNTSAFTVSERVAKNFSKHFAAVSDAQWVKDANGFVVRFTSNGIQNWAYLTKQGHCYSTMRYYTENELPAAVREQVKSAYENFEITSVKEVQYDNVTSYLVTIADAKTWKVVRVINGELDVWESHQKG